MSIKVGIIGCGKIAQVRHIPEYAANPHAEVYGFYDINLARAQQLVYVKPAVKVLLLFC